MAVSDWIALLVTVCVLAGCVLSGYLVAARAERRTATSRAIRAGHPCAPPELSWGQRVALARDAADLLAGAGRVCTRACGVPVVRVAGLDGQYVLSVNRSDVAVSYLSPAPLVQLGPFRSLQGAIAALLEHTEDQARLT